MTTTATYDDAYAGPVTVRLVARKTRKGTTYRWESERGTVDGLRPGVYSIGYQLRHASGHARFSDVREG